MYKDELLKELYDNVLSVIFKKVDGTMRKMRCTLDMKYIDLRPDQFTPGVITVWDLDEGDWRRFRVDSVQTIIKEFESDFIKPIKSNGASLRSNITKAWLDNLAVPDGVMIINAYEGLTKLIRETSTEVLYYLCYGGVGHLNDMYRSELLRRGTPFTPEIEAIIQEETTFYD